MNAKPPSLYLVVQNGPIPGQEFLLAERPQTIGRGTSNDMVIADLSLSRHHARIRPAAQGFIIEDLGSTNGTYVNEGRVTGTIPVRPGDTIRLGNSITLWVKAGPAGRSSSDDRETLIGPALTPGREPDRTLMPAHSYRPEPVFHPRPPEGTLVFPPAPANGQQNLVAWLGVGLVVLVVALLIGGGLGYLYLTTRPPQPAAGVLLPTVTPLPATATPSPTPVPDQPPSPTPAPIQVPGVAAGAAVEQAAPAEMVNRVDPFCNDENEVLVDEPVFITWQQRLAQPDGEVDYVAAWLASAYYDLTLDGRPLKTFYYYRSEGPALTWWANLGLLPPGRHYLRMEQYTDRPVSSGLDLWPADGQVDVFGPGAAGEGFCEIIVPAPALPPTPTPSSTPPPEPTPAPRPATSQPPAAAAPLGIFQDFETMGAWKRGDQPYGQFTPSSAQVHSGSYAGQLGYNFPSPDNDYVVFQQSRALAGRPDAISAWVYGDRSGHFLNIWIKDAGGQSWQMSFGPVKHSGWQEMTAFLDPGQPWPAGHISGPDNGVIDYPISFLALVLDDAPDSYSGQGTLYIDDLTSREGTARPAPAASAPAPTLPSQVAPSNNGLYVLSVGQHKYEPWGAARNGDICESYRQHDFDDKIRLKGFNLELLLTNNSTALVADDWSPVFMTAKNKNVQVCYYGYAGSGPRPGATSSMTFFTIVEPDDYVRVVQLDVNGQFIQICLDGTGALAGCN